MLILLLNLLKDNWKTVLAVICFSLWSIGCYNRGAEHVQAKWDKANIEATNKAYQIEHDNILVSNIIGGKYESSIAAINNAYNSAVRLQPASSNLPSKTNSTSKPDAATCSNSVHKANERIRLAKEAEINTAKLIALQEWVNSVK